jgi:glycosyltransferase involved in cell wall biosynthesis
MNITGIILAKDEEDNIKDCIKNLSFCDEVVVIDDASEDATRDLAKNLGAKVFTRDKKGNFASQRNFALRKAQGRWVLFIDADERLSDDLINEIKDISKDKENNVMGYYVERIDCMWGKVLKHGETGNIKLLRFARRRAGKWKREVHETWNVVGKVKDLKNPLIHLPHPTLFSFIESINEFSDLHAKANRKEGKRSSLTIIVFWPPLKFIESYIFKLGFLDGAEGFMVAMMMSLHSFMSWSKLWMLQKNIQLHKN